MSRDSFVHTRRVKSITERIASIGGFLGALSAFCSLAVSLVHRNSQYLYLTRELFVEPVETGPAQDDSHNLSKQQKRDEARKKVKNTTQWSCLSVLMLNLKQSLPMRCRKGCFKMRDKDHLVIKAYKRVEKELTITHILR